MARILLQYSGRTSFSTFSSFYLHDNWYSSRRSAINGTPFWWMIKSGERSVAGRTWTSKNGIMSSVKSSRTTRTSRIFHRTCPIPIWSTTGNWIRPGTTVQPVRTLWWTRLTPDSAHLMLQCAWDKILGYESLLPTPAFRLRNIYMDHDEATLYALTESSASSTEEHLLVLHRYTGSLLLRLPAIAGAYIVVGSGYIAVAECARRKRAEITANGSPGRRL